MTSEQSADQSVETLLAEHKPGAAFAQVREKLGVSLDKVSSDTLIPVKKLIDLERDEYSKLGGDTFVVGYFRMLAKSVDVDSDPFVECYLQLEEPEQTGLQAAPAATSMQVSPANAVPGQLQTLCSKIKSIPLWGATVAILVVWVAASLLLKHSINSEEPSASHKEPSALHQEPSALHQEPSAVQQEPSASHQGHQEPSATVETSGQQTLEVDSVPHQQDQRLDAAQPAAASKSADTADATNGQVVAQPQAEGQQDLLVVTFSQDCWIKITDATGEVLFAELKRTGDNLQLFGEAPFEVMLGNARAAEIVLNGDSVDVVPTPGRKTLKLIVD